MTVILDFVRHVGDGPGGTTFAWGILLRVTVLLLAGTLVALALRRSSAALRHLVWGLALVGALLIPLCYCALPAWQWAILPQPPPPPPVIAPIGEEIAGGTRELGPPYGIDQGPPAIRHRPAFSSQAPVPAGGSLDVPATPPTVAEQPPAVPPPGPAWSWTALLVAGWALGTLVGLVWLGIGVVAAWHVARRAEPAADPNWHSTMRQLLEPCGIRRPIAVRECPEVSVPMTWGLRRPVILVPAGSGAWSDDIKRSVLLHELGHVRRRDCLMLLLGRLACVAYWFHPLAWLAARQLRKTSEQAADDLVLASNVAPPDYAEHLVGIAAQMRGFRMFGPVALPMAGRSDLEGRVRAILDPRRNRRSLKRTTCYAIVALAVLLVVPCAVLRLGYAEDKRTQGPAPAAKTELPNTSGESPQTADVFVVGPDGRPVADAEVRAFDADVAMQTYRTDPRGGFRIPSQWLSSDRFRVLLVARQGGSVGWRWLCGPFQGGTAENPAEGRPLTIALAPCDRAVEGTCVDARGRPVANTPVRVTMLRTAANTDGEADYPECLGRGISDAQGHFSIKASQYEFCFLVAEHPEYVPVEASYRADSPGPKQIVLKEPAGSVRGRVVDAATGSPIGGARVFAQGIEQRIGHAGVRESVSDANGRFVLASMAPGRWNVLFGGLPQKPEWTAVAVEGLEVKSGEAAQAEFRACAGRLLSGQVLDAGKKAPLPGVSVGCYSSARPRSTAACTMVKTDVQGRFEFRVPPGEAHVYVAQEFRGKSSRTLIVGPQDDPEPVVFSGALSGPIAAGLVTVAAAEEAPKNAAQDGAAYTLRGTLRTADGKPVPGAIVHVWTPRNQGPNRVRQYAETHRFVVQGGDFSSFLGFNYAGKTGETWYLVVDAAGFARSKPIAFTFAKEIGPLAIVLERPVYVSVRGRALDAAGQPLAKANVSVSLSTVEEAVEEPWGPEYLTDKEGRFELKQVHVGNRFAVRIEKEHYLAAVSPRMLVENADPIDFGDLRLNDAEQGQAPPKVDPETAGVKKP